VGGTRFFFIYFFFFFFSSKKFLFIHKKSTMNLTFNKDAD